MKPKLRFASSWDDGHAFDEELADMLKKFGLPGTFYLPGDGTEQAPLNASLIKRLVADGFEVGGHTINHPADLKLLSDEDIYAEIEGNKKMLEALSGQKITKFCYPRGRYDKRAIEALKKLGFTSARTTMVLRTSITDPFQTPTSIHVYQRTEYGKMDWDGGARIMVAQAVRNRGIFHIWGHSWEISRDGNWEKLSAFFEWLVANYEIIKV